MKGYVYTYRGKRNQWVSPKYVDLWNPDNDKVEPVRILNLQTGEWYVDKYPRSSRPQIFKLMAMSNKIRRLMRQEGGEFSERDTGIEEN